MGLVLDTTVLIDAERKHIGSAEIIELYRTAFGEVGSVLSAVSVMELSHGIYRARTLTQAAERRLYVDEVCTAWPVYDINLHVAKLAGKIEGEQAARGEILAMADVLIGATALHLDFSVVTLNLKHFQKIPGLSVIQAPALR